MGSCAHILAQNIFEWPKTQKKIWPILLKGVRDPPHFSCSDAELLKGALTLLLSFFHLNTSAQVGWGWEICRTRVDMEWSGVGRAPASAGGRFDVAAGGLPRLRADGLRVDHGNEGRLLLHSADHRFKVGRAFADALEGLLHVAFGIVDGGGGLLQGVEAARGVEARLRL